MINDNKFYQWLKNNFKDLYKLKKNTLIIAIEKSIKIKLKFIINDEKEKLINSSSRAMLNFGHSFGHALESMNNYNSNLTHGEAISIGMVLAAKISYKLKNIRKEELEDIIDHFNAAGLPSLSKKIKKDRLYKVIASDKKNTDNKINLILLKKIGKAYYERGLSIKKIKSLIN